jgi:hypothetical protein
MIDRCRNPIYCRVSSGCHKHVTEETFRYFGSIFYLSELVGSDLNTSAGTTIQENVDHTFMRHLETEAEESYECPFGSILVTQTSIVTIDDQKHPGSQNRFSTNQSRAPLRKLRHLVTGSIQVSFQ